MVSIHAPTGGATSLCVGARGLRRFQFTRPRGARRNGGDDRAEHVEFQFTRPRGARPGRARPRSPRGRFNSRAHGGRDVVEDALLAAEEVSIHAPTGGATGDVRLVFRIVAFQFTRPRGARPVLCRAARVTALFQFTRPRGARRPSSSRKPNSTSFNSRAHGGRDRRRREESRRSGVSIHAPTGGATVVGQQLGRPELVSIHAPTGGATWLAAFLRDLSMFQFTRPRGARPRQDKRRGG